MSSLSISSSRISSQGSHGNGNARYVQLNGSSGQRTERTPRQRLKIAAAVTVITFVALMVILAGASLGNGGSLANFSWSKAAIYSAAPSVFLGVLIGCAAKYKYPDDEAGY